MLGPLTQAGHITYTLNYQNVGNQISTSVVITETVPAYSSFSASASSPGWTCPFGGLPGNQCTYFITQLSPASGGNITFTVSVDDRLAVDTVRIANTVSIAGEGTEINLDNNHSTVTTTIKSNIAASTSTPTSTSTATATSTSTAIPTPTPTSSPSSTPTATYTPVAPGAPTHTPTGTSTATATSSATSTPASGPSPTATVTATNTAARSSAPTTRQPVRQRQLCLVQIQLRQRHQPHLHQTSHFGSSCLRCVLHNPSPGFRICCKKSPQVEGRQLDRKDEAYVT